MICNVQDIFEVGRRYKIMNPDKMRSEYGKLIYMLMDAADPTIQVLVTLPSSPGQVLVL